MWVLGNKQSPCVCTTVSVLSHLAGPKFWRFLKETELLELLGDNNCQIKTTKAQSTLLCIRHLHPKMGDSGKHHEGDVNEA